MARIIHFACAAAFGLLLAARPATAADNWTQFLGPSGDAHADTTHLPLEWSETENVVWKTAIHDRGWSSPVIWGNQVWMTTATPDGKQNFAVCVDKTTGKIVYDLKLFEIPNPDAIHEFNSYASPSPVIEEGRVYVNFGGDGTACIDTNTGEIVWTRTDLKCYYYRGAGSSPVLFENLLIELHDGYDVQYMVALDKATGKTVWQKPRNNIDFHSTDGDRMKAFATPQIIEVDGQPQMIAPASRAAISYDPRTGEEIWRMRHPGYSTANRPVFAGGLVIINTGYDRPELHAVRPDGKGDVTDTHVVWKVTSNVPNKPSQVALDGLLYMINDRGVATCMDLPTGQVVWTHRVGGNFSASPLVAQGRIYFFSQEGVVTVIEGGREYKQIARNQMDDGFMSSPAVSGDALILRTRTNLYRVEAPIEAP